MAYKPTLEDTPDEINQNTGYQPTFEDTPQQNFLQRANDFADKYIDQPFENTTFKKNIDQVGDAFLGAAQGVGNIPYGVTKLGTYLLNKAGANIPQDRGDSLKLNFAPNNFSAAVGDMASALIPGTILGKIPKAVELANAISKLKGVPGVSKGIDFTQNILSKSPTANKIAASSLLGGVYSPDDPGLGMTVGGLIPPAGKLIGKGYNTLRPSNLLRGNLTADELRKNLEITSGTQTGLGDVIGSPMLKRLYENWLTKIPFSGANDKMMKTAGTVVDKGHGILDKLLGENNAEDFEHDLNSSLQDAYKGHKNTKELFYKDANNIADKINLQLPLEKFANTAKKYSDALESTNILKFEPDLASMINKLKNYKTPVETTRKVGLLIDKESNPLLDETTTKTPRLKEANLLKGRLNELAEKYSLSPNMSDRHAANVFGELASSLKDDINSSIEKSGHLPLKNAYNKAESNYANNFSPFLDKEIYKFSNGNADSDTLISSFIKTGKANDRANLINKLIEKLPENKKNLLGYGYLQRAIDQNNVLNPMKVRTLLSRNSLGPNQLKALFPNPQIRNELLNYSELAKKNSKGLRLMENPETGQMNMDILPLLSKSGAGLAGKILGAKPITSLLTNETLRNNLVRKMLENESRR